MVHLMPLPGSAQAAAGLPDVVGRAVADAQALAEGGVDAVLVENLFDAPFHKDRVPPHTIAAMTAIVGALHRAVTVPVGVNVLRNDVRAALAIAEVCGGAFVRCNVYVGAAVTDQGIVEGAARQAVAYRRRLGSAVCIWADVDVKHAVQLGGPPIEQQARDAVERGLADGIIVSGPATGRPASAERIRAVKLAVPGTPVLVGSGLSTANAAEMLGSADGAIVGSSLKQGGRIDGPVDPERVRALVEVVRRLR
jgi:membrane complex biogenesis BtpA family protein